MASQPRSVFSPAKELSFAAAAPSSQIVAYASAGKDKRELNFVENFLLGGTAAAVAKTIAAPIERIKLLLQNQGESAAAKAQGEYKGIIDICVRVPKEQGFASFWRGNLANVIRYFPTQALNFMFKERYKKIFKKAFSADKGAPFVNRLASNVCAGGAAGATSLLVVYPLDFARTRLAMDVGTGGAREFNGTVDCILKTAKTAGWFKGGVYNGFTISCVGIIIYRGAYFGLYDTVSPTLKDLGFAAKFGLGYAVTTVAGLAAYPIDTIRRRMMMQSGTKLAEGAVKYTSSMHAAQHILANDGVAAMFKGAGSNILRGLAGALVLVGFEYTTKYYKDWKFGKEE